MPGPTYPLAVVQRVILTLPPTVVLPFSVTARQRSATTLPWIVAGPLTTSIAFVLTVTLPGTVTPDNVHDALFGTTTLPLSGPVSAPVQVVSACAADAPRSTNATMAASANRRCVIEASLRAERAASCTARCAGARFPLCSADARR